MQEDNIIKGFPLEDILEFSMRKEAIMTQEELNIIYSYGFFLLGYFAQNNCIYYTFRRKNSEVIEWE